MGCIVPGGTAEWQLTALRASSANSISSADSEQSSQIAQQSLPLTPIRELPCDTMRGPCRPAWTRLGGKPLRETDMTAWSRHRPRRRNYQGQRLFWGVAVGLAVALGVFGLSKAFSGDESSGSAPPRDRAVVVRIPGAGADDDADGVQAPPRPPVKEQADRKAWNPGPTGPRRYSAASKREAPPARSAPPARIQPPSPLDAVALPQASAPESRPSGETQTTDRSGAGRPSDEPRPVGEGTKPTLRLFIDKLSVGERQRTPQDEEPAAREPARVVEDARQGKGDEDGAPIRLRVGPPGAGELPRPQVLASEQPAEESPSQERLPDGPAAEASNRSLAERIEMLRQSDPPQEPNPSLAERIETLRQGDTPEEPEGEVAQVTDSLAGAEAGSPAANRSEAATGDPQPMAEGRAPVELKLSPNRPAQARAGQPIRLSVGPAGEVEIAEGPAAKGSSSSAPRAGCRLGRRGHHRRRQARPLSRRVRRRGRSPSTCR